MVACVNTDFDVIVMGSGIAGGFLSRQLKITSPALRVLVLEAAEKMVDYKVGESTVEVSASYMIRRLGLSAYLYQHQLPKNGLRFFFDSEAKDLPLTQMTEMGSDHLPFHPSFQLERASLERDLVVMNQEIGIDVELGAKVVDISIDANGGRGHTVTWERGGERHEARARWLCDASGRRQLLARKLGHKVTKEPRLETGAAWGRYRKVAGLDAVNDPEWRARVRHTSRHLSTNHFMYDGYWIWFIPLAGDLMSVGVVFDKARIPDGPRTREQMEAFVHRHRATSDLLEGAEFEDFQGYAHLPFHTHGDPYFSASGRWAKTGEAGSFTDPFYSPGSDFISVANELITGIIVADMKGDSATAGELSTLANDFHKLRYESSLALYVKQYPIFGSFDVFRLKYRLDFHNYYNLVYWPFLADKLTEPAWLKEELRFADLQLRAVNAFGEHLAQMGETLHARGEYFAMNRGGWLNGLDGVAQLQPKIGSVLDEPYRKAELDRVYASVFTEIVERVLQVEGLAGRSRVLRELSLPVVLALKQIDEASLARMLQRVAGRLTNDLKARFPDLGVERVGLSVPAVGSGPLPRKIRLEVFGPTGETHARVVSEAQKLWEEGDLRPTQSPSA
jgi:flavin-dependent dehydrogenase